MKNKQSLIIILIIISGLLSALSGILGNLASNTLASAPYAQHIWIPFVVVTLTLIGIAVWQYRLNTNTDTPILTKGKQIRQRMLTKVYAQVTHSLEQSLHGASLIILGLLEKPDAVVNTQDESLFQQPDASLRSLLSNTHIGQIYDRTAGELLILGGIGSGKTTLLLELARDLLDRAMHDDTQPIPVVFNLSSWDKKRQPIVHWLVKELYRKYRVPYMLGRLWVGTDQVVPLLDGLDQVDPRYRTACINAINDYRRDHGMASTVVCSLYDTYMNQKARLLLENAVVIQPLTLQQIDSYLANFGGQGKLEALREILPKEPKMLEMAAMPLLLSKMAQAYFESNILMDMQLLVIIIVQSILRGPEFPYKLERAVQWTAWLAHQMVQHSQDEFYLERMQPDWLPNGRSRHLFYSIIRLFRGISVGLLAGLLSGFSIGMLQGSSVGLLLGFFSGLLSGLIIWVFSKPESEIHLVEVVTWSWLRMWQGLIKNLFIGILVGLATALSIGLAIGFPTGISIGLAMVLIIGFVGGLNSGISSHVLGKNNLFTPNNGVWRSMRNSLYIGLTSGLSSGLLIWLVIGVFNRLIGASLSPISIGLDSGLMIGFVGWLIGGGNACIEHVVLRLFLFHAGYMPWNYIRFLNCAAKKVLLIKVGGGYVFVHRVVLDYLASLNTKPTSGRATE